MNVKKLLNFQFLLLSCFLLFSCNVFAMPEREPDKKIEVSITKEYKECLFKLNFSKEGDYSAFIISPDGKEYECKKTVEQVMEGGVQYVKEGTWVINIYDNVLDTIEDGSYTPDIGPVKVSVEASKDANAVVDDIKVGKDLTGLKTYMSDSDLIVTWTDATVVNVHLEVMNPATKEIIKSADVKKTETFTCSIPEEIESVILSVVPASSKGIEDAIQTYTISTINRPEATITFPSEELVNTDNITVTLDLKKGYKVNFYNNSNMVKEETHETPGVYNIPVKIDNEENNILCILTDIDTGYCKSYEFYTRKDVTPPLLQMDRAYDGSKLNYTEDEVTIGGTVKDFIELTINDVAWSDKVATDGHFEYPCKFHEGENTITVKAVDDAGNESMYNITVAMAPKPDDNGLDPQLIGLLLGTAILGIVGLVFAVKKIRGKSNPRKKQPKKNKNRNFTENNFDDEEEDDEDYYDDESEEPIEFDEDDIDSLYSDTDEDNDDFQNDASIKSSIIANKFIKSEKESDDTYDAEDNIENPKSSGFVKVKATKVSEPSHKVTISHEKNEDREIPKNENTPDDDYIDYLTGLKNAKAFKHDIKQFAANNISIAYCCINEYDNIYSKYGRSYGDKLLSSIAKCLKNTFHGSCYRLKNDKFVVIEENKSIDALSSLTDALFKHFDVLAKKISEPLNFNITFGYSIGDGSLSKLEIVEEAALDAVIGSKKWVFLTPKKDNKQSEKSLLSTREHYEEDVIEINSDHFNYVGCAIIVVTIIIVLAVIGYFFKVYHVSSDSMTPNLIKGEYTFNSNHYKGELQRGDIVSFEHERQTLGKRIIGLPGETISFQDGYVYINSERLNESKYLPEDTDTNCSESFVVPSGSYFVLGDNREQSNDSRFFENPFISRKEITSKYLFTISLSKMLV